MAESMPTKDDNEKADEVCAVCKKPFGKADLVQTLACEHVVHQQCWYEYNNGYIEKVYEHAQAGLPNPMSRQSKTERLRCPICSTWHGANGCEGAPMMTVSNEKGDGHREWAPPNAWWKQPVKELMHQVLGYIYQRHCLDTLGSEGNDKEEFAFCAKCRNRLQKSRGGQQQFDVLEDKLRVMEAIASRKASGDSDLVPPKMVVSVSTDLVACIFHHVVETKKGKVLDQKQADEWMQYMRPWLITAGLTRAMIDEIVPAGVPYKLPFMYGSDGKPIKK